MNKNQLKKVINNLQTYVDNKIDNLPASYEEKLLITVPKESIDKSKVDTATDENPYTINIPGNGFEYVEGMFNNADIIIEYNGKKYMITEAVYNTDDDIYFIKSENNYFAFDINKVNSSDTQLLIFKLDTTNITDIKLYMRKKDINIANLKVGNSISIGRVGSRGPYSAAIGYNVEASGTNSHAEGNDTEALGHSSHAEGSNTIASGSFSHAEGIDTKARGDATHAEGNSTIASGSFSHAEGNYTKASSDYQHVQGKFNIEDTANKYAHIVGNGKRDNNRSNAHTLDWEGNAWFAGEVQGSNIPHVISEETVLTVPASSIDKTKAAAASVDAPYKLDVSSVFTKDDTKEYFITYGGKTFNIDNDDINIRVGYNAEGTEDATKTQIFIYKLDTTNVTDIKVVAKEIQYLDDLYLDKDLKIKNSISVGNRMGAIGIYSSAIGGSVIASGDYSHAEGNLTKASGDFSHSEGSFTTASGYSSHAEGDTTTASGDYSHAEGNSTTASGDSSHAEGDTTIASGNYGSHAEGYYTKASSGYQHVQGRYNIEDTANKYAHIVGNGKNDSSTNFEEVRSNAHTLDWEGNAWFAGQVEGTNLPYTVSSKVLGTVPANTILGDVSDNDDRLLPPITISNASINKDRRYYMEFLGSKKLCSLSINEEGNAAIECNIGNYVIGAHNDSPDIVIVVSKINPTDTTTNATDLVIYEEEVKYLDSKYLETDLVLQNSISLGRAGNIGPGSSAIGSDVIASGNCSHAEGNYNKALGYASHAEGGYNMASGACSHAEGNNTKASADYSHAEGSVTTASGYASHAEGDYTKASSDCQHVQGRYNIEDTANKYVHIVGNGKKDKSTNYKEVRSNAHTLDWEGNAWYAGQVEGTNLPYTVSSKVLGTVPASNVKLDDPITVNNVSINKDRRYYIEFLGSKKLCSLLVSEEKGNCIICNIGNYTIQASNASTDISVFINKINTDDTTTDTFTDLIIYEEEVKYLDSKYLETDLVLQNSISLGRIGDIGAGSSAIGMGVKASGDGSHAEGAHTTASGEFSHAEGAGTTASGDSSHAEGTMTKASGVYSHAEGNRTTASGKYSHAEGANTIALGISSHVEGVDTTASGDYSHAEGSNTTASGNQSHAEGTNTTASGNSSHVEGSFTTASGNYSHAEGIFTTASGEYSHAEGNSTKASSENQHVQGQYNIEDTANKYAHIVGNGTDDDKRSNAHTLDWKGNAWYSGKLSQEGTPTEDKDLVTKKYVDEHSISVIDGFTMRDQTTNYKYLMQLRDGVLTSILLPSSISVDSSSLTNLMEGDVIEGNDLTINATYPDGTTSALSDSDKENITCTPKELNTDVKQITVKYKVGDYELTQIINVTVSAFDPAVKLQDFNYTSNANGTYTLTGWKETHNGVASTEMIIPNNKKIIL